ncbi:hypothetical protein [Sphingorhabdus sp. EL138]|uniref:hypothetical protein n=1 Tax=Sphingorhabdus sp. EL138 TaxID=2073156 RepID=UPI000D699497|nr:hypothetical protein [Sphingorhabdus sp. EL138]
MTPLTLILVLKVSVTMLTIVVPFLFFSRGKIDVLLGMRSESSTLYRLYGVGILALLVAYAGGIYQIAQGDLPVGVIAMGLVSNFGGTATLILTGGFKRNKFHTFFFGFIALCLAFVALNPEVSIVPIY